MAGDLRAEADESGRLARVANQNSDDYVILTVLAAMVLFFAGLSTKLLRPRNRMLALGLGVVLLFFTLYLVLRLPVEI
jgi:type II secretory pathway component PulM